MPPSRDRVAQSESIDTSASGAGGSSRPRSRVCQPSVRAGAPRTVGPARDTYLMADTRRSRSQLLESLDTSQALLLDHCAAFDQGKIYQALAIAVQIRVLVHDTKQSSALLSQLQVRDSWQYYDSARARQPMTVVDGKATLYTHIVWSSTGQPSAVSGETGGLVVPGQYAGKDSWVAPLSASRHAEVAFHEWWTTGCIDTTADLSTPQTFSRSQLVRVMANQAGGAHVDPSLPDKYTAFKATAMGLAVTSDRGDWTMGEPPNGWRELTSDVAAHTMRQIGHEMLQTITINLEQ